MAQNSPNVGACPLATYFILSMILTACGGTGGTATAVDTAADPQAIRRAATSQAGEGALLNTTGMAGTPSIAGAASTIPSASTAASSTPPTASQAPLVRQADLAYLGAFRYPAIPYTGNVCDSFAYGGAALTFNPAGENGRGTLLATAHVYCNYVGEFTIPEPKAVPSIDQLPISVLTNSLSAGKIGDPLEGTLKNSAITGGTEPTVNGLLVSENRLVLSAGNHYGWTQPVSHWSRPLNLSVMGQVLPASRVAGPAPYDNPRFLAGYMCSVPEELRSALGGPAITGWVPDSIVSTASNGPSAFAFNPSQVGTQSNVPATPLLFYPEASPLQASVQGQSQDTWNWTSMPKGCAIPNGTRSLLFVGRHGTGKFDYGVGGTDGHSNDAERRPIYDPSDTSTGEHAWPYKYFVWAYDTNDLARARTGAILPYSIRPYSVWSFTLPFADANGSHSLGGITYDPTSKRLYVSQNDAAPYGEPIIHVFEVTSIAQVR